MKTLIKSGNLATAQGIISSQNVLIENGFILEITQEPPAAQVDDVVDLSPYLIAPGYIDIHIHGAAGFNFISANHEQMDQIGAYLASHGVTRYLATLMETEKYKTDQAVKQLQSYTPSKNAAVPIGIHLEGPYLSSIYPGDMGAALVHIPDPVEYIPWLESGLVRMITVAPELPGSLELIQAARERGIIVSIGHGAPDEMQVQTAFNAGASQITHMFNQMLGLDHHKAGLIDAALLNDSIALQIIADEDHLHPVTMQVLTKLKDPDHLILITDSTEENGAPFTAGDKIKAMPGTLTLDQAVRNMMLYTKAEPLQALKMASASPAKSLHLENHYGSIQPGAAADFVALNDEMQIIMTIINGKIAYQANQKIA